MVIINSTGFLKIMFSRQSLGYIQFKKKYTEASPEEFIAMKFSIAGSSGRLLQVTKVLECYEEQVEDDYLGKK